jgi:hypothetical protein
MLAGRYRQMFLSTILINNPKIDGSLNTTTGVPFDGFPVLTYARKILQSVAGHIGGGHRPTFSLTRASGKCNPSQNRSKEDARFEPFKRETTISMAAQSSKKDTLQTRPIGKR